jgi:type IV pilus assembly protein PilN
MRISLNLATRPFADLGPAIKRLRIAMGALAVIAIGLGLALHAFHRKAEEARARDHSLDSQIARIAAERQGYQNLMRQPENAQLLQRVGELNQIFDEKAFSWTLAMEDLETVLPGGVQVSTLEPVRAKDGSITLRLRVIGPRDKAVDLVRNLEHSRHFLLPRIVGENSESSGAPGEKLEPISASNRVNFDLLADYNPASPAESRKSEEKLERKIEKSEAAAVQRQQRKLESHPKPQADKVLSPTVRPATPPARPEVTPGAPAQQTGRFPFTRPAPPAVNRIPPNPSPVPNQAPGLNGSPNANPNSKPNAGGPQ